MEKSMLTDTETDDKDSNGDQSCLVADIKVLGNTANIGRDNTGAKGNRETGDGHNHGAIPFVRLGPVLWVLRVAIGKFDHLYILLAVWRASELCRLLPDEVGHISIEIGLLAALTSVR